MKTEWEIYRQKCSEVELSGNNIFYPNYFIEEFLKKRFSVEINDVKYYIPKAVADLILSVSEERDELIFDNEIRKYIGK